MIYVKSLIAIAVTTALGAAVVFHSPASTLEKSEHLVSQTRLAVSVASNESGSVSETVETGWVAKVRSALASVDPDAIFAALLGEANARSEISVGAESEVQLDANVDSATNVDLSNQPDASLTIETDAGTEIEADAAIETGVEAEADTAGGADVGVETGTDVNLEAGAGGINVNANLDAGIGTGLNIGLGR